ncbi:hypothetical protein HK096_004303, partial [Nowakowskiella sp. JEL0078]
MSEDNLTSADSGDRPSDPKKRKCSFLKLAPSVTILNFTSYRKYPHAGFVLGQIISVPENQLGNLSGSLTFYDELFSLVMVWVWGLTSDIIGRRTVYSLAYIFMAIGLFIFTFASDVYPQLLIFRLIFALGGSAGSCMLTAVLADYAGEEDRGKISAVVGLMTGCGALLALFVFLRIPSSTADPVAGLRKAFFIVGGIAAFFGVFIFFTLRKSFGKDLTRIEQPQKISSEFVSSQSQSQENSSSSLLSKSFLPNNKRSILNIALEGIKAARDPVILVGYIGGFLARADTIIVTTFLPLLVYKYYIANGLCSAKDPNDPDIAQTCRQAYVLSSTLSGVSQTLTLVGAPIF